MRKGDTIQIRKRGEKNREKSAKNRLLKREGQGEGKKGKAKEKEN